MGNSQLIDAIFTKTKALTDFNVSEYVRLETLGEKYGFKEVDNLFHQIKLLSSKLLQTDLIGIPRRKLDSVNDHVDRLSNALKNIKEFDPDKPKNGDKASLINNLDDAYFDYFQSVLPIIAYNVLSSDYISNVQASTQELLSEIEKKKVEISNKSEEFSNNADHILKSIKDTAAESGVTRHSKIFADEASDHKKWANIWFGGIVVYLIATGFVIYLIWDITPTIQNSNLYQIVQYSLLKVIIFSVLYYLLIFIMKNYNAHRHNFIVNKHKQNALSTFETFVRSTTSTEIKDAVLLQTTQAIFSNQISGYLKNESEDNSPNKFIEIIRNIGSVAKGK